MFANCIHTMVKKTVEDKCYRGERGSKVGSSRAAMLETDGVKDSFSEFEVRRLTSVSKSGFDNHACERPAHGLGRCLKQKVPQQSPYGLGWAPMGGRF